jgi:hypothetical protein
MTISTSGISFVPPAGQPFNPAGSAAGTTQATATPLPAVFNFITTAAPGSGVIVTVGVGEWQLISNQSANTFYVWPVFNAQIGALGINTPLTLDPEDTIHVFVVSSSQIFSF